MLLNRQSSIPGRFDWFEPETGWTFASDDFRITRDKIVQHRRDNPRFNKSTDLSTVESEMETRYSMRLRGMPGGSRYLVPDATDSPPPSFSMPRRERRLVEAVATVKRAVAGLSLLKDWLGDDLTPVKNELAEARSAVCATCPQNKAPNFLQTAYSAVASGVHLLMNHKAELALATSHDAELKTCKACDCDLKLKVWTPIDHIRKHTPHDVLEKLDPRCWIPKE